MMPVLGLQPLRVQWCIDKENNYFLHGVLDAGSSPQCCAITGWAGVAPEGLMMWVSMGPPAQGLPESLQYWTPMVLLTLCVIGHSSPAGPCLFACSGGDALPLVYSHGLQFPGLQGEHGSEVMDFSCQDLSISQNNWETILGFST